LRHTKLDRRRDLRTESRSAENEQRCEGAKHLRRSSTTAAAAASGLLAEQRDVATDAEVQTGDSVVRRNFELDEHWAGRRARHRPAEVCRIPVLQRRTPLAAHELEVSVLHLDNGITIETVSVRADERSRGNRRLCVRRMLDRLRLLH